MQEFQKRILEVVQDHKDFVGALKAAGIPALVEAFGYGINLPVSQAAPLLSGTTVQGIIPIRADSYFVASYLMCAVSLPNASTVGSLSQVSSAANILLQVTDTGVGETLFSQPTSAAVAAGTVLRGMPGIPFLFPIPRLIRPNTNVRIEATQLGLAAGSNLEPVGVYVTLMGMRVGVY